jgi:DNA-binding NarL/FixJ family response regulator
LNGSSSAATTDAIGVLIADSNRMQSQLLTSALRRHAEFHVTTCPMEAFSILQAIAQKPPHIALLSLSTTTDAAESVMTLRRFHLAHPEIPKVLLVDTCDRELVVSALRSGARGIFPITDANLRLLCKCLLRVAAGQIWANSEQLNYVMDLISEAPSLRVLNSRGNSLLTPREEQVVALVAEGMANREIARELNLSEHTIKTYLYRVFEKLGISSRVELVLYAVNHGDPRNAEWLAGANRALPSA